MNETKKVAYCGLYCGDCFIKDSKVNELSKLLLSHMKTPQFGKLVNGLPQINETVFGRLSDAEKFHGVLESMHHLDCYAFCKDGGGSPGCEIRRCCQNKTLDGCWECESMEQCNILAGTEPINQGANVRNIRKIKSVGMKAFLDGAKEW